MGAATPEPWYRRVRWDLCLLIAYVVLVLFPTYMKGVRQEQNVFRIYRASFEHLVEGRDLYAPDPERHRDVFLYSPTFAALMAPFARLPFAAALLLWNTLNVFLLWFAVRRLLPARAATAVLALVLFEVLRTTLHSQSNALVTGLIVLVFVALEHGRTAWAAACVALGAFVKVFPLGAAAFALHAPRRWRFAAVSLLAGLALAALPLLFTSPSSLAAQYASWGRHLAEDAHAQEDVRELPTGPGLYGGVAEQLRLWFGRGIPNLPVLAVGLVVLILPLLRGARAWADLRFRRCFLGSFLVFCVIFNHESESPSFVIAVTGIAIWYVTGPRSPWRTGLMALTVIVVSVSSMEVFPPWMRDEVFHRYRLKTVPCLIAWLWMQVDLWAPLPEPAAARAGEAPVAPA